MYIVTTVWRLTLEHFIVSTGGFFQVEQNKIWEKSEIITYCLCVFCYKYCNKPAQLKQHYYFKFSQTYFMLISPPQKNLHLTSLYNRIKTYPRCICSNISHIAGHTSIDSWYTIWFILSADKPACTVVVCTPTSLPGITTCVKFRENYLPRHLVQKLAGINQRKGCTCTRNTELEWLEEWMQKGFIWGGFLATLRTLSLSPLEEYTA